MKKPPIKNRAILNDETVETKAPETIRVRVVGQPVNEAGVHYAKGEEFDAPADRAAALGALVEPA